ncbi:MAG: asparagine synthetase B, partial [Ruminococcus sp.]|nr:asparagine synthetase B [Ruminococcus sp.]
MTEIRYFSGYIRNWKKLCTELGIALPLSREARENAVLLKGFEKWGVKLPEHLYGAFAIAIWDDEAQKLCVFRDQVGQKQMFYAVVDGELLCSVDIDAIVSDGRYTKKLNMRMLQQYLFYGYPIGAETFYEGVYKLQPGHYAVWDGKDVEVVRYFMPTFAPEPDKTPDELAQEIRDVVAEIFAEERDDDELSYKESFLSGGVDSSYL